MVWRRMGLLDDAIREHLELKRRRGADPSEVAREEREALDTAPVAPDAGDADASRGEGADDDGQAVPATAESPAESEEAVPIAGETAELDMTAVLAHDGGGAPVHEEDSLEWEMPARDAAGETPPDEATIATGAATASDRSEDVLEETPDFLRDTPEQERMWFEQRPPRDFDFDK
jgi:hypothetical protein